MACNPRYEIDGHAIQHDPSGVGSAWYFIDQSDVPYPVQLELEGEIINGQKEKGQLTASNGLHYRWLA